MFNKRMLTLVLSMILLISTMAFGSSIPLGPYYDDTYFDLSYDALILKVIPHEKGGLEADVSAYDGLLKISGGITSIIADNSTNWDTAYNWGDWNGEGFITDITGESIGDLGDVDLTGIANGKILKYNSTSENWECEDESGGGYTNLTSFVDQIAWRLFYSNTDGDVIELALGTNGQYLKSNGETSAPTFDDPAGGGDMTKAIYDTEPDNIVDKAASVDDGVNSATAANIEDAVNKKHSQNTDTLLSIATALGDHEYVGITDSKAVGENVVFGQLLYFDWTDAEWKLAKANAVGTTPAMRIALETKGNGEACLMLVQGYIRDDSAFEFTAAIGYLSITTGGAVQYAAPSVAGNQVQRVGIGISADIMYFAPSIDVGEI